MVIIIYLAQLNLTNPVLYIDPVLDLELDQEVDLEVGLEVVIKKQKRQEKIKSVRRKTKNKKYINLFLFFNKPKNNR